MFKNNTSRLRIALITALCFSIILIVLSVSAQPKTTNKESEPFKLASDYSKQHRGLSVLVLKNDKIVFEEYQNGHSADKAHRLASGTKSFSGVLLAAAIQDGLIKNFDEKVSHTIKEWKNDHQKKKITIRQLLSLTSGMDTGGIGRPPSYADSIKYPVRFSAGEKFQYGPAPFQIFGEVLRRKLAVKNETVMSYLKRRIFNPIGLKVSRWRMQKNQPNLPSGAFLTAREWAKFGQLLLNKGKWDDTQIIKEKLLDELIKGSEANPNYGLTFWLNRSSTNKANIAHSNSQRGQRLRRLLNIRSETDRISQDGLGKTLPRDIFVAAGAGKQRLYVIPSKNMVIVRQGRQSRFDDNEFLRRLLFGKIN